MNKQENSPIFELKTLTGIDKLANDEDKIKALSACSEEELAYLFSYAENKILTESNYEKAKANSLKKYSIRKLLTGKKFKFDFPYFSLAVIVIILVACLLSSFLVTNSNYLDISNHTQAPSREFWLGTDSLGRDIFSNLWYGGRVSIVIGIIATIISTLIAIIYGTISGLTGQLLDNILMRFLDVLLSVPSLLLIVFGQALWGRANVLSIAVIIGISSWFTIAKVVRTEVLKLREETYVRAAKAMGGKLSYILRRHLAPNFVAGIMFMVAMNVRSAIIAESTLSFIGLGLPLTIVSWGSMISLAGKTILTKAWWIIVPVGLVMVLFILSLTNLANYWRAKLQHRERNL